MFRLGISVLAEESAATAPAAAVDYIIRIGTGLVIGFPARSGLVA